MRIGPQAFLCVSCFLSNPPSTVSPGAYFLYHKHQPFLTNMWMTLVPSGRCFTRWNRLVIITKETFIPSGVGQRMDAPPLLERYITILVIPVIVLAIVLLPFIAFVLYTWWSQRRRR